MPFTGSFMKLKLYFANEWHQPVHIAENYRLDGEKNFSDI